MADIKCMWIDTLQSSSTNPKRIAIDIANIMGYMIGADHSRTWIPSFTTCQWFDKKLNSRNHLLLDYICVSVEPAVFNWSLIYEKDGITKDIIRISSEVDTLTITNLMCAALCSAYVNGILETEEDE